MSSFVYTFIYNIMENLKLTKPEDVEYVISKIRDEITRGLNSGWDVSCTLKNIGMDGEPLPMSGEISSVNISIAISLPVPASQ